MRLLLLTALLLAGCVAPNALDSDRIEVTAAAVPLNADDPLQAGVGRLRYLGGLSLVSTDPRFGGLSGLRWSGRELFAVSDVGGFVRIQVREVGGRLAGVESVRYRPLLGADGKPLEGKEEGDAEALTFPYDLEYGSDDAPDSVEISFEGRHRVWGYRLEQGWPVGPPSELGSAEARAWLASLPGNGGVEAMGGNNSVMLWLSEEKPASGGGHSGWLFHNGLQSDAPADRQTEVAVRMPQGFSPTDLDEADFETYLVLGRHYTPAEGPSATISLLRLEGQGDSIATRVTPIATLAAPLTVDNMEGLAVRRVDGRTFVYLVSDDNFSKAQRTLLMKFELVD